MRAFFWRIGFKIVREIATIVFTSSFFIHQELCKQWQHESIQAFRFNLNVFCIRVGKHIKNIFFIKYFWNPVYPVACKKVVNYYNAFTIGTYFLNRLMGIATFTAENSMFMSSYGCTKCLDNVDCIGTNK